MNTVAVLAGGLKHIYPPENFDLARRKEKQAAVVSEFPLAVKPAARKFLATGLTANGNSETTALCFSILRSQIEVFWRVNVF